MATKNVYGICGMCTVRCPMMGVVEDGRVKFIQGNPHAAGIQGSLCARGAAGVALIEDDERPQFPMIRTGERGEGKWRKVSWDEALDYVAEKLNVVRKNHGDRAVLFSDRGGPFRDLHRAFLRAIGTPNYCNHDASCARNVQHAALSMFGFGRKGVGYDLKNAKHVVLQTRNIFEAINVKEVNDLLDAMQQGCRLSVIDIRSTVSAAKAHNFFQVRPGTDYAFNLAVINVLLKENLYDRNFAKQWISDMKELIGFISPYTPQWAAQETGIPADRIVNFAQELAEAAPSVIWHPGWMNARYSDSFYMSRTAYIINSLLGAIGAKGGLPLANKPKHVGRKGLNSFMELFPKPKEKRVDGVGTVLPHIESGPGLIHLALKAIQTGEPYPVKAYIAYRHDPLMALPDPDAQRKMMDNLDLMVSITFSWSDTAWYSDVVLPLSPYLERESIIACKNGLKPFFFKRDRIVEPRFDTRSDWEIVCGLAKKMGIDELSYESVEDIWNFQLKDTGVELADFEPTGMVPLASKPLYRPLDDKSFATPSAKIQIIDEKLESQGIPSLKPYESPEFPPEGQFRVTFGRCGVHTQGHTVNNPLLAEQMPENVLWINTAKAADLNISDGEYVEISSNGYKGRIKAFVTDHIHPDAVFMVHGFGHRLHVETRAHGRGVADHELMPGGLEKWDRAGGALALQEHFVTVTKEQT
ncbi:MAG: molybdopterin-dependent oxidoreductase [Desulfovibrionales bacterium]